jgi:hypothetical protein
VGREKSPAGRAGWPVGGAGSRASAPIRRPRAVRGVALAQKGPVPEVVRLRHQAAWSPCYV